MTEAAATPAAPAAPVAAPPPTPSGEAPAVPAPAEGAPATPPAPSRRELEEQKLAALRLRNAERKARLDNGRKELEERAKELEGRESTLKRWKEDPRAALEATGLPPKEALEALVQAAHLDGTPEGEIAKMRREFAAEQAALKNELAELKKAREDEEQAKAQRAADAQKAQAEKDFVESTLAGDKFAPLKALRADGSRVWSDEHLVAWAWVHAQGFANRKQKVTDEQIADAMLAEHLEMAARFGHVTPPSTPAPAAAGPTVNGGRKPPNTIANRGAASPGKPRLTFAEKVEAAKRKFAG